MKAISAKGVSKTYWFYEKEAGLAGSLKALLRGRKVLVEAVRDIEMNIELGEVVGFIGPNGAGKTTTLKMLSGILHPTRGDVTVLGFVPTGRDKAFLKKITFISGQRNRLFWDLPAAEYFEFCRVVYEIPKAVFEKRRDELVALAEIGDILKTPQRKLSFGQRKRCELVAGLLHDPQVIFLDEPTNAMDLVNARRIRQFIKDVGRAGKCTVILTSHNMSDIEQTCERVIIISQGDMVFDGDLSDLKRVNGPGTQIRVVFEGPWSVDQIQELGMIKERNGKEIWLEVEADQVAPVAARLFHDFPVKDISIEEPKLETVIESIFARRES